MTPLTLPQLELRLAVQKAETRAAGLRAGASHPDLEDHRTEAVADLLDAIDRIDCGLGTRMLLAMYPKACAMHGERRRAA